MSAFAQWSLPVEAVMSASPVVPVIVLDQLSHALPMAEALLEGGISVMEVTLRTPVALAAISAIANAFPQALVGAGTVCNRDQLTQVYDAGGKFVISPGATPTLLAAAAAGPIPLLPGISTVSELMAGMELGYQHFKFFPAEAAGGVKALKAISGPFPEVSFCPTGGISTSNYLDYLRLSNVSCVGGSWLVPADAMAAGEFGTITRLAREALQRV